MQKTQKNDNIILRIDSNSHDIIKLKSIIFGKKKSDYIRYSAMKYWEEGSENSDNFKEILNLYKTESEQNRNVIIDILFQYYRLSGFPYVKMTEEQQIDRMRRIVNTKTVLIDDKDLSQNTVGLDLVNFYHKHMSSVDHGNSKDKSPYQMFDDDILLKDCIKRWLDLDNIPSPSGIRRILKTRNGARSVTNFKPAIAKFIYTAYSPIGGRVLDPCAGYSGRLSGCIASMKNLHYHGIDPDGRTAVGNMQCASLFSSKYDMFGERDFPFSFSFDLGCAEDVMLKIADQSYDLVFTSPPYFSVEKYSSNPNQSYLRYPQYEKWRDEFLYVMARESYRVLKPDSHFVINIKNYHKIPIADDLNKYCEYLGFKMVKTYNMRLSNREFHLKSGNTWHTEPIFVWQK